MGGLPKLMADFSSSIASRALRWCEEEDADSVAVILLAGRVEAFVGALGLKPGGCNDTVMRQRLAAIMADGAINDQ